MKAFSFIVVFVSISGTLTLMFLAAQEIVEMGPEWTTPGFIILGCLISLAGVLVFAAKKSDPCESVGLTLILIGVVIHSGFLGLNTYLALMTVPVASILITATVIETQLPSTKNKAPSEQPV